MEVSSAEGIGVLQIFVVDLFRLTVLIIFVDLRSLSSVGSCWNTPIETIRVLMQRDVSMGKPSQPAGYYWKRIVEEDGYAGLFRGVTPRAIQAIWQTVFMVVVPNMLGI